jgi:adenylate kinase
VTVSGSGPVPPGASPGPPGASPADGRRILLLMGAVGAGKGTQAGILAERLGLPHLASGDLFRRALSDQTPIGRQAKTYMDRGELVPDDVTIAMFMDELAKPEAARGAVLDGFPRTVAQAKALDATLAARGERLTGVFYIDVPNEELVARVAGRWVCPVDGTPYHVVTDPPKVPGICDKDGARLVQRDDDKPEVVRARLAKQVPPMLEVLDHYRKAGIVIHIDGRAPIEDVTRQILQALGTPSEVA